MKELLFLALLISACAHAQDADTYYKKANEQFNDRMYRNAAESATKAIELNPSSIEYRWFRVQALFTSSAGEKELLTALSDLEVIRQTENSEKLYRSIGKIEYMLAQYYNTDFGNYTEAAKRFELSKSAFQTAKKISGDSKYDYDIRDAETYLNELQAKK